ncbi:MAG: acyl carrier protein [Prosthecobacter sp.]|uniref:acyl carrier protein n=1 Tax=Prosthecobacter sp. TaxID=1965333 RepID=UPI003903AF78
MNVTQIVLEFFDSRGGLPGASQDEKLACAYLDAKIVDSMGIIDMVSHFEDIFDIRFDADDLQSQEFQTVGGLIGVIEKLRTTAA